MRIVLPPSETKQPGGEPGSSLNWSALAMPALTETRAHIADDLMALSATGDAALKALGLGAKASSWLEDNLALLSAPVMPAIGRYTGVLFDALDYSSLSAEARARADRTVWLFSALFGPIRATDVIPRYRLSFDSKLPGEALKKRWQPHAGDIWSGEFSIDLRSEGYRALAPLTEGSGVFIRVVRDLDGAAAVGHANKGSKGKLVRELVESGAEIQSADDVIAWGRAAGWTIAASDSADELLLATG
jgi:cytoplasmic iron level regulating protein YaaA (DUF328/UPF0246 family)